MIGKSLDETIFGATQFGTYVGNLKQNIRDTRKNVLNEVDQKERQKYLNIVIKNLNPKEKNIYEKILAGNSFEKIAKEEKVTKQAVFKIWKKTAQKIKSKLLFLKNK